MVSNDIGASLTPLTLFAPATRTATANGTGVDLKNAYQGLAAVILANNTTSGTSPTMDVKIQDSADNSTYADVTGYTFTQVTAALTNPSVLTIDIRNLRRYARAVVTMGGTSPSFLCSVTLLVSPQVT